MIRRCLRIPFVIGQNEGTIIGNSCADNPVWEVPCGSYDFPEDQSATVSLPEPTEKAVVFT